MERLKARTHVRLERLRTDVRFYLYLFKRRPLAIVGAVITGGFVLTALLAPLLAPYDPMTFMLDNAFTPPSKEFLFGTDFMGRDIYSRVIWGSRISLLMMVSIIALAATLGSIIGAVSGYFGGLIDNVMMRVTDVFLSFPSIVLALAFATVLGQGGYGGAESSMYTTILAVAVVWWPHYSRLMRSKALSLRELQFIEAAKAIGCSSRRIVFSHLIPNCVGELLVMATLDLSSVLMTASTLGFIGVGVAPNLPEWGAMVSVGRHYLMNAWWISTLPGLVIVIVALGANLLGDGLRDVLDPHFR